MGRKLALAFFEPMEGGLARRVDRGELALKQHVLALAESRQTVGDLVLLPDPRRTSMEAEALLEK